MAYSFFLGANSSKGFISFFNELYTNKNIKNVYIIKGTAGSGKSSFMKKIANFLEQRGDNVERVFCSSDPQSLDAIISDTAKVAFVDGTSPHSMEPKYPIALDTYLNFAEYLDYDKTKENADDIIRISDQISQAFKSAYRYIKVSDILNEEAFNNIIHFADIDKLKKSFSKLVRAEIPKNSDVAHGNCYKRFITGITPEGIARQYSTIANLSNKVIYIKDNYDLCPFAMEECKTRAINNGYDVFACYCPINPSKLEHVIIPQLQLSFTTMHNDEYYKIYKSFNLDRFVSSNIDKASIKKNQKIRKLSENIMKEAILTLKSAKSLHDDLEQCFVPHMDFERLDLLAEEFLEKI